MTEETLSDRITQLIGLHSHAAFARQCGFSVGALRNYLAHSMPSADKAHAIAKACNVSMEWLLTGVEPEPRINYPESVLGVANPEKPGLIDRDMLAGIFKRTLKSIDKHEVKFPIEVVLDICIATYNSVNDPDLAHLPEDERFKRVGDVYARALAADEEKDP